MSSLHRVFITTVLVKGALGLIQLVIAVALYFGILGRLPGIAEWIVAKELSEDPGDFLATHLLALANIGPTEPSTFYISYFSVHGLLHVSLVVALLSGLRWANLAAVAVLSLFVVYQLFEWFMIGGKLLLVLTAIDLVVIALTLHEDRHKAA